MSKPRKQSACDWCGGSLPPYCSRFCSAECREKSRIDANLEIRAALKNPCPECGGKIPKGHRSITCSRECRDKRWNRQNAEGKIRRFIERNPLPAPRAAPPPVPAFERGPIGVIVSDTLICICGLGNWKIDEDFLVCMACGRERYNGPERNIDPDKSKRGWHSSILA